MILNEEELNQPRRQFDEQSREINKQMKALLNQIDAVLAKSPKFKKQDAVRSSPPKDD